MNEWSVCYCPKAKVNKNEGFAGHRRIHRKVWLKSYNKYQSKVSGLFRLDERTDESGWIYGWRFFHPHCQLANRSFPPPSLSLFLSADPVLLFLNEASSVGTSRSSKARFQIYFCIPLSTRAASLVLSLSFPRPRPRASTCPLVRVTRPTANHVPHAKLPMKSFPLAPDDVGTRTQS